jgi:hypothetical protein
MLSTTKIFALLDIPLDERDEFMTQSHEINRQQKTVNEMTSRELQQAIKAKKEAEDKTKQIEEEKQELESRIMSVIDI